MKMIPSIFLFTIVILFSSLVKAHGDEDHAATTATVLNDGMPRIVTHSDLFELVGIVENGAITLYLDRYSDNSPVTDAKIEVEVGSEKGVATVSKNGTYHFPAKAFENPSAIPITFTIISDADSDLLAGDLVVAAAHVDEHPDGKSNISNKWRIGTLTLVTILILIAGLLIRNRRYQKEGKF